MFSCTCVLVSLLTFHSHAHVSTHRLIHRVILVNYRGDVEGTISQYDITRWVPQRCGSMRAHVHALTCTLSHTCMHMHRFLELHISDLGEVGSLPLSDLGLQHKDIHLCDQAVTVEQAFRSMVNSNHYGVAVVDAGKKMVANLSISEIRVCACACAYECMCSGTV